MNLQKKLEFYFTNEKHQYIFCFTVSSSLVFPLKFLYREALNNTFLKASHIYICGLWCGPFDLIPEFILKTPLFNFL